MVNDEAAARLHEADRSDAAVRRASQWSSVYLAVFGVATLAVGLVLGLAPGVRTVVWTTVLWGVLVAAMAVYAARQSVLAREFGRILGVAFGGFGALLAMSVVIGTMVPAGGTVPSLLLAFVPPIPLFVGAVLVRGRR